MELNHYGIIEELKLQKQEDCKILTNKEADENLLSWFLDARKLRRNN